MGYREEVLADNPIIYLPLDEPTGSFTNLGSLGGVASRTGVAPVNGIKGTGTYAQGFNGSSSVLLDGVSASHWDRDYTVELWVRNIVISDGVGKTLVWFKNLPYWYLSVTGDKRLYFVADDAKSGATTISDTTDVTTMVGYHHVVVRVAPISSYAFLSLWIDGVKVTEKAESPGTHSALGGVEIGDSRSGFSPIADIDEVAIYPTSLSEARIRAHYNAGISRPPFTGWGLPL